MPSAMRMPVELEGLQHGLRFLLLVRVAFVHHFLEDVARTVSIAHVDIGPGQIQLGVGTVALIFEVELLEINS